MSGGLSPISVRGIWRRALDHLTESVGHYRNSNWNREIASVNLGWKAYYLAELGRPAEAYATLQEAVEYSPTLPLTRFLLGRYLYQSGELDDGDEQLAYLEQRKTETNGAFAYRYWSSLLEAEQAMARGETERAADLARQTLRLATNGRTRFEGQMALARALDELGDKKAAIALIENSRAHNLHRDGYVFSLIPMYYWMAVLHEESGDVDSAMQYYQRYLARWGEADVSIRNVEIAKERLARLEASRS